MELRSARGLWAFVLDWFYPFSASRAAVAYIASQPWERALLVGHPDILVSPVAGHLARPIFYPQGGRLGTFVLWNEERRRVRERALRAEVARARGLGRPAVFILDGPELARRFGARLARVFPQSIVSDETYFVYVMDEASPPEAPPARRPAR